VKKIDVGRQITKIDRQIERITNSTGTAIAVRHAAIDDSVSRAPRTQSSSGRMKVRIRRVPNTSASATHSSPNASTRQNSAESISS
jgi:hypothetical protein